jgi:hypothetical protein
MRTVAILLALLFASRGLAQEDFKGESPKPTRNDYTIAGWTVRIDRRLLEAPNQELGQRAMKLLEARLTDISMVVAPDRLAELRAVPIVMDLTNGNLKNMQYHPSADWLEHRGFGRELAKCVHIPSVALFTSPRHQHIQPWCVLHELAHSYHDRVLGFNDARIRAAYDRYVASGHGQSVLLVDHIGRVPHYALTNEKEFFAEMSECYFGVNDFFPFTNAELRDAEPEIYALLADIWGPVP